jgi:hypothetical protein
MAAISYFFLSKPSDIKPIPNDGTKGDSDFDALLDELVRNVVSGGPPKDGIPPVEDPKFVSASDAEAFLVDEDVVFIVELDGVVKVYPQNILVWHEIVNDEIEGETVSVTYCPLTGSAIGYKGNVGDITTTYGTSGKLINSNLLMYDRATDSYWPQIFGVAIKGPLKGEALDEFPVTWTRWGLVKQMDAEIRVLSQQTGFIRSYGTDPYGSYLRQGTYYDSGEPFFPVLNRDRRLEAKEVVIGLRNLNHSLAILKTAVVREKVVNLSLGDEPIVAIYDESLDAVRVYTRRVGETILNFEQNDGSVVDVGTASTWNVHGRAVGGSMSGTQLEWVSSFDVMWFAWAAFFPETEVYQ